MNKSISLLFLLIVAVFAEQTQQIISLVGFVVLGGGIGFYVFQNYCQKEVVEFQTYEATAPTPVTIEEKGKQLSTFSTESMKQTSMDSSDSSPRQHKKRKRKAHRLSDRRKNQENEDKVQEIQAVQQDSQL